MGSIVVSEAHAVTGGTASSTVAASFIPDAATLPAKCTQTVAGCELALVPDCGGTCGDHMACGFDTSCTAKCQRICDAQCSATQECYFPTATTSACRDRQSFDAGTLTLSGTTTPVTLFPPYSFAGVSTGSLYADGAALGVVASGASTAGYTSFTESFSATHVFRTSPGLDKLGISDVFGAGDLPIAWTPGEDDITITATTTSSTGVPATLTCKGDDKSGKFALPRQAITAALKGKSLKTLTVSVTRSKTQATYDIATMGMLSGEDIQPTGWLEASTSSTETTSFAGCENNQTVCGNTCVDTQSSAANCGSCGNACASGDTCDNGTCAGASACNSCVMSASTGAGACASAANACTANADCSALKTCLEACTDSTCSQNCANAHMTGLTIYNSWSNCICQTGCTTECASECGG
jgi:hypothetical protein